MGYNKIIVSGNTLELYEYEKNIHAYQRIRTRSKNDVSDKVLDVSGADSFSERQLGKRRDNARRSQSAFARLVRANLDGVVSPVLFTFTYKENQTDLKQGYRDFRSYVQALRYRYGKAFKYIVVPEFQERGAVHFHAFFWSLPSELVFRERTARTFAQLWGLGFVDVYQTDGNEKLSTYLAKYMTKAYLDPRLKSQKAYVASRNCLRPRILSNFAPVWPVLEDYELSPGDCLQEKHYMTQWLGRGKYRRYQLKQKIKWI